MSPRRTTIRNAAIVFLLALVVRVLFLYSTSDHGWPHSVLYEGDAPVWVRWAQALDRGEAFEFDLPMRTPAMAFALHWLSPAGLAAPFTLFKVLWCAIGAATCALLYVVVARQVSARAAWVAAGLLCFSFGGYEIATSLCSETPYAFLLVLLIGATLRLVESPRASIAIALGVLHGAALLLRAEHLLLLALFLGWTAWSLRSRAGWTSTALIAIAAFAICLPWIWRSHLAVQRFNSVDPSPVDFNLARPVWTPQAQDYLRGLPAFARQGAFLHVQFVAQQAGLKQVDRADLEAHFARNFGYVPEPLSEWTLVSSKGALDFALANDPAGAGGFSRAALYDGTDADPEFALGRPSHLKLYNHGFAVAWQSIHSDLPAWLGLVGKKLERFSDGATLGWSAFDLPYGRASLRRPVDLATPLAAGTFWRVAIGVTILAGMLLAWRTSFGALCLLVLGYKLCVTVLFYGYARQAVSIAPVFYAFGAIAIDVGLSRIKCPPRLATGLGVATLLCLLGVDVVCARSANQFDIRATDPRSRINAVPQWGPGAFETIGEIEILPR